MRLIDAGRVVCLIVFVACGAAALWTETKSASVDGPAIVAREADVDVGTLRPGESVEVSFSLHNRSEADVQIFGLMGPGCDGMGCLEVLSSHLFPLPIASGTDREFRFAYKAPPRPGLTLRKSLEIATTAPGQFTLPLTITGRVADNGPAPATASVVK